MAVLGELNRAQNAQMAAKGYRTASKWAFPMAVLNSAGDLASAASSASLAALGKAAQGIGKLVDVIEPAVQQEADQITNHDAAAGKFNERLKSGASLYAPGYLPLRRRALYPVELWALIGGN